MTNTFHGVAVDCADAAAAARFWAAALGREVASGATSQAAVVPADAAGVHGPRMSFHQVPEPKTVKNRLHLDFITTDFEAEAARLTALGARKIRDIEQGGNRWITFADIEGNEFDLIAG
jgi:predicted enzyme related to lactoylglutathione lyase